MGRGENYDRCRGDKSYIVFSWMHPFAPGTIVFWKRGVKAEWIYAFEFYCVTRVRIFPCMFWWVSPSLFSFVSLFSLSFFFFRSISKRGFNVIYKQISRMKRYAKTNRSRRVCILRANSKINLLFFFSFFLEREYGDVLIPGVSLMFFFFFF